MKFKIVYFLQVEELETIRNIFFKQFLEDNLKSLNFLKV